MIYVKRDDVCFVIFYLPYAVQRKTPKGLNMDNPVCNAG
jgi:hypothetical protein